MAVDIDMLYPRQRAFLAAYRVTASVSKAASICELERSSHYSWLRENPNYAAAFQEMKLEVAELLEDEAVRRAYEGTEEPQWYKGQICGHVKRYSDLLLIFLMKGAMPEKYKDRQSLEVGRGPTLAELLTNEEQTTRTLNAMKDAPADDAVQQTIADTSHVDDANKDT